VPFGSGPFFATLGGGSNAAKTGDMALRILYIEDHDDTRRILSRLLRHFHYEVVAARDYRTARAVLDRCQFDVLISDIALPDGDGCDLVMEAKSKQPLVSIAYTAYGTSREVERGFSSGFDHNL
jgi:CheY-like chemotaxis protein